MPICVTAAKGLREGWDGNALLPWEGSLPSSLTGFHGSGTGFFELCELDEVAVSILHTLLAVLPAKLCQAEHSK